MTREVELRDKVRKNLAARGDAGAAWLDRLPALVERLEAEWKITVGETFPNATEAYVAEAVANDGTELALKIPIVGIEKTERELRFLEAAAGHGYVRLVRAERESGAMLLERLGPQLAQMGLPIDKQMAILCATLKQAWMKALPGVRLLTGAEKAGQTGLVIERAWPKLNGSRPDKMLQVARRFVRARRDAYDPHTAVVAHGDAHAWNLLHDPKTGGYKFVDPEGLFIERAHDVAISMREWPAEYLAGDAVALGRTRCALLSRLTGADEAAIWQWGYLETLVNGLLYTESGQDQLAARFLDVAETWAGAA
ncbi:MAG TPA: aminoglycoside phosphotransferase family protein [Rhizomicrobium sp.]|nr:aminoglycoside phosphotransferase family protein [Rhizomicrobium sp.]